MKREKEGSYRCCLSLVYAIGISFQVVIIEVGVTYNESINVRFEYSNEMETCNRETTIIGTKFMS